MCILFNWSTQGFDPLSGVCDIPPMTENSDDTKDTPKRRQPKVSDKGRAKAAEREERLAQALRDNLRRRKGPEKY